MRFLLRLAPHQEDRTKCLASIKAIGSSLGASVKHPRWTSYGALEVDVFSPSEPDFSLFLAAAEPLASVEFSRNLDEAPAFKSKEEVVKEARGYFNAERFWECHEGLEPLWRSTTGQERKLVQAIILVCAAQVHEQRDERDVALGIYRRALPQIAWIKRDYQGINVAMLRRNVERSITKGELPPFKI
ncbi:MAG TPA: DUF309 domain-containing protein [Nitrososphaerales archaeon]|nr:DUF309 domain-containing protein [Nitrososphaerales archaeon]